MGNWKSSTVAVSTSVEDESSSQLQEHVVMAEALENPLILHKIIKSLDFLDLRTCRLVTKTWNSISSEIMRKRDCSVVIIKFDLARQKFRQCTQRELHSHPVFTSGIRESQNLEFLTETLQNSPPHMFPSTHFIFFRGDLSEEGPQKFFRVQGEHIKTLELIKIFHEPSPLKAPQVIKEILQNHCPNLETLNLKNFNYELQDSDQFTLVTLKRFLWANLPQLTAINILKWSPNLETTKDALLDSDLQSVQLADKVSTVRKLHCGICNVPNDITSFANMMPRLVSMEFSSDDLPVERRHELSAAFTRLLQVCKDTLLYLDLNELCYRYEIPSLPPFGNLTQLKIGSGHRRPCFPVQGIHLTQTFPKLEQLDCSDLRGQRDVFWTQYFPAPRPFLGNLPLVKCIEIFDNCNDFFMHKLEELCPNFEKVVIHGNDDLAIILRKVFARWHHLKGIELRVHPFSSLGQFPNLDSAITGFDQVTCDLLGSAVDQDEKDICQLLRAPCICDVKNLENFKIVFEPHSHYELGKAEDNQVIPLSHVSGRYAFQMMCNLKVSIQFDHNFPGAEGIKSTFQSIGPYVNFHHVHNFRND